VRTSEIRECRSIWPPSSNEPRLNLLSCCRRALSLCCFSDSFEYRLHLSSSFRSSEVDDSCFSEVWSWSVLDQLFPTSLDSFVCVRCPVLLSSRAKDCDLSRKGGSRLRLWKPEALKDGRVSSWVTPELLDVWKRGRAAAASDWEPQAVEDQLLVSEDFKGARVGWDDEVDELEDCVGRAHLVKFGDLTESRLPEVDRGRDHLSVVWGLFASAGGWGIFHLLGVWVSLCVLEAVDSDACMGDRVTREEEAEELEDWGGRAHLVKPEALVACCLSEADGTLSEIGAVSWPLGVVVSEGRMGDRAKRDDEADELEFCADRAHFDKGGLASSWRLEESGWAHILGVGTGLGAASFVKLAAGRVHLLKSRAGGVCCDGANWDRAVWDGAAGGVLYFKKCHKKQISSVINGHTANFAEKRRWVRKRLTNRVVFVLWGNIEVP